MAAEGRAWSHCSGQRLAPSVSCSGGDFTLKKCLNQENNSTGDGAREAGAQWGKGLAGDSLGPDGISGQLSSVSLTVLES